MSTDEEYNVLLSKSSGGLYHNVIGSGDKRTTRKAAINVFINKSNRYWKFLVTEKNNRFHIY